MAMHFTKISENTTNDKIWVWKTDETQDCSIVEEMMLVYPIELGAFKNNWRKIQWSVSRKIVFDNFNGKRILQNENGYPTIENEAVFLSISHSKDFVVVKVSDKKCGIDVEHISEKITKIKHKFLSPEETTKFGESTESLIVVWTAKEALYKMLNTKGLEFKTRLLVESINFSTGIIEVLHNVSETGAVASAFIAVKLKFERIENYIFTQTI